MPADQQVTASTAHSIPNHPLTATSTQQQIDTLFILSQPSHPFFFVAGSVSLCQPVASSSAETIHSRRQPAYATCGPPLRPLALRFSTLCARLETLEHLPLRHLQPQGPKTQSLWSIATAPGLDWSCDRHPELSIITPSGRTVDGHPQCQTEVQKARRSHVFVPVIVSPHVSRPSNRLFQPLDFVKASWTPR